MLKKLKIKFNFIKSLQPRFIVLLYAAILFSCSNYDVEILATVNNENINIESYLPRYQNFLFKTHQKDNLSNRYTFLNSLVDERLILDHSQNSEIANDPDIIFQKEQIFNQLLLNRYHDKKIRNQIWITDNELRRFYMYSKTSLHVRHLYSSDLAQINQIHFELKAGEKWETLANKYFQDPKLKNNGGDLGWYKMGELDPAFEVIAFSLDDGEISDPIKTRKGFSIIQVLEKEKDIFLTENDFQNEKPWLTQIAIEYKRLPFLRDFTDKIEKNLDIRFEQPGLEELMKYIDLIDNEGIINNQRPVLYYKNKEILNIEDALVTLSGLSKDQFNRIQSIHELETVLRGLLIRKEMISDAKKLGLDRSNKFQTDLNQEYTSLILNNQIKDLSDPSRKKDSYLKFRDHLALDSYIKIDSLAIKSFPMVLEASF